MQPHQQRVVNEAAELDDRLAKLLAFFDTPTFAALDTAERDRLHTQAGAMVAYSDALESRINAFAPAAKRPLSADLPGSVIDQIGH
jgi:uncharacterized membrane protein YccC